MFCVSKPALGLGVDIEYLCASAEELYSVYNIFSEIHLVQLWNRCVLQIIGSITFRVSNRNKITVMKSFKERRVTLCLERDYLLQQL